MRIDSYAHGNRWRSVHPGEKGLLSLLLIVAALLSRHPALPLVIALLMTSLTILGAGIPWQGYLRLIAGPLFFLLWSSLLLPVTFTASNQLPWFDLALGFNWEEIPVTVMVFSRSLGALSTLLFLALTTPLSEIAGLLRTLRFPRLFVELTVISYRQTFILLEALSRMRSAQQARLGYSTLRSAWRSSAELAGNILIKTITRARNNHQALTARGYDSELRYLTPLRQLNHLRMISAGSLGLLFLLLAARIQP